MKALSVLELAKLYGMNRQSIYKRINKGDLSKNSNGKIDISEAIRVFGEPSLRNSQNVALQSKATVESAEVDILKQKVDMLHKQLELAQERERFQREQLQVKDDQIYSLQLLLGAPKPKAVNAETDPVSESNQQETVSEPKLILAKRTSKKRGFLGRLVQAVFDDE